MTKAEAQRLQELGGRLAALQAELQEIASVSETAWTMDDLEHELDRWRQYLVNARGPGEKPYSEDTIKTHTGHAKQFLRWLTGEWRPTGPRS